MPKNPTIKNGTAGNDVLSSTTGYDILNGLDGDDRLVGGSGENNLFGGNGNDRYYIDADVNIGTNGISEFTWTTNPFTSTPTKTPTNGIDLLDFSATTTKAINVNIGTTAYQTVAAGVDLVIPIIAIENVNGGGLSDTIFGNNLDNSLAGGAGDDTLSGGDGNDKLYGDSGNDILDGGVGRNTLSGGAGNDRFLLSNIPEHNTIIDFTTGQDKIVLPKSYFQRIVSPVGGSIGGDFATFANESDLLSSTSSAAILYSQSSGSLYYNENGSTPGVGSTFQPDLPGTVVAKDLFSHNFATLQGNPMLTTNDFSLT
jgi:Ca2+-binding RTX toxin-like protein